MPARTALTAASMLLLATCNLAAEEQPAATPTEGEVQDDIQDEAQDAWTEFSSPERGFAISFPGRPKISSTPVEGLNPLTQHAFEVSVGEDAVYNVVVFEYPDGKAPNPPDAQYYNKVMTAYAKGSGSRLRKKGPTTIADRPGYEATADSTKGKLNHLIDIVPNGDRIYMLVTAGPKRHAKSDEAQRFRDSFRILGD